LIIITAPTRSDSRTVLSDVRRRQRVSLREVRADHGAERLSTLAIAFGIAIRQPVRQSV